MSIRAERIVMVALSLGATMFLADSAGAQAASAPTPGARATAPGSAWADAAKMPDLFNGMWMTFSGFVEADKKLNVPYTPKAQKFVNAYKQKRDIPYAEDGCQSPGLPIAMRTGPIQFSYSPGLISIYMQAVGHTRFIKLNEKLGRTSPKYYGNSVGHWEGDTLVVETEDFLNEITFQYGVGTPMAPERTLGTAGPDVGGITLGAPPGAAPPGGGPPGGGLGGLAALSAAIWGPHGERMRMVERMRLVNPDTLEVALTIYDDTVWTRPYVTAPRQYKRIQKGISEMGPFSGEPEEWVCTVSITSFDPETNTYNDKDPEEMVKFLEKKAGK